MTTRPEGGAADGAPARRSLSPSQIAMIVASIGLVVTASLAWTARTLNAHNEHRLLEVQARQAAAVISSTILSIEDPLATALQIETATAGDPRQFRRYMSAQTGAGRLFVAAALWEDEGSSWRPVVSLGAPPALVPTSSRAGTS